MPNSKQVDCPNCAELRAQVARLSAQVRELTARLNQSSRNSSKPPSSDPPSAPKPPKQAGSGSRGGKRGHKGVTRLLATEITGEPVTVLPEQCPKCSHAFTEADVVPGSAFRHQVIDIPVMPAIIMEFLVTACRCPGCGKQVRAKTPGVGGSSFGPRAHSLVGTLTGGHRVSRRSVRALLEEFFGISPCLGTISAMERRVSDALKSACEAVHAAIGRAAVVGCDETPWKQAGRRNYLWVACTDTLACFQIHRHRSRSAFEQLISSFDPSIQTLVTDRYTAYGRIPGRSRQFCWAHIQRAFQALLDRWNGENFVADAALTQIRDMFRTWKANRSGRLASEQYLRRMQRIKKKLMAIIEHGTCNTCAHTQTLCRELNRRADSLWVFLEREGVPLTNNQSERAIRPAVLWRKTSNGHQGESGKQYVERMLTTVETLNLQQRKVCEFLVETLEAKAAGRAGPSLVPG